jgi:hypothetical protein
MQTEGDVTFLHKLSHWTYNQSDLRISSTDVLYAGEAKLIWSSFDVTCIL